MNAITSQSAQAMQHAEAVFKSLPVFSNEAIAADFIKQIDAGYIHPKHMADVLYAMHNAMVDRFEGVALWMPTDLEQVADDVLKAVGLADAGEQE
jgi:hypothetical protein